MLDEGIYCNTLVDVAVYSDGFSANAVMDTDIKEFAVFSEELLSVYRNLKGTAKLKEPYGDGYIIFSARKDGYIGVNGKLLKQGGEFSQELIFENTFDQTYLRDFAEKLSDKYHSYLI